MSIPSNLKTREYYEDIYDKGTVEQCRFLHHHNLEVADNDIEAAGLNVEETASIRATKGLWVGMVQEIAAFSAAAERFNKKEAWIDKMMTEDKAKDHLLATAQPPANARCRKCHSKSLHTISKDLWHDSNGKENRVLFMFTCRACGTNTAFYDDGEEWIVEPTRCPECRTEKVICTKTNENEVLILSYVCERCGHVWQEVHDYGHKPEKEEPDPTYDEDRKLYCYSKKVREWAEDLKNNPMRFTKRSWEESETEKLYKAELAKIEMLTVKHVEERLGKLLAKNGYKDFALGKPDLEKELQVIFTAIDDRDGRSGDDNKRTIWKLVSRELETTNWRLIRNSIDYRVGYIKGKLRAYENKLELEKLVSLKLSKRKNT